MSAPKLVRDAMSPTVVSLGCDDRLVSADDIMRLGRIRHIPVLNDVGALMGIVSQTDLFRGAVLHSLGYGSLARRQISSGICVRDAMTRDVATISPDAPLQQAARVLLERKIGCLVVIQDAKVVGILTESDFVKLYA